MAVSHGMDVGEVRRLGGSLQTSAGSIDDLIKRIDSAVSGSTWVGPDATTFKGTWWPEHRAHLIGMSEKLYGLGQSALNNASEQERVSGATGGSPVPESSSGGSPVRPGGDTGGGSGDSSSSSPVGAVGSSSGVLSEHRSDADVIAAYRRNPPRGYEPVPGNGLAWQCTSWIQYRWRELGYEGPMGQGNGWEVATNNGGSADTPPSLGAIASYGTAVDNGHVMVVEELSETAGGSPRIRVSEMNAEGLGADRGSEALPEEYRDDRWFVQQPNGAWVREGGNSVGEIRFATFPGG